MTLSDVYYALTLQYFFGRILIDGLILTAFQSI